MSEKKNKRWTIDKMKDYREFCGWDTLQDLLEAMEIGLKGYSGEILIHDQEERKQTRAITATTFETGARIGEVLGQEEEDGIIGLRRKDFKIKENSIFVFINLEKQYDTVSEYWEEKTEEELEKEVPPSFKRFYEPHPEKENIYRRKRYETERKKELRRVEIPRQKPLVPTIVDWIENREGELFDWKYNRYYRTIKKAGEEIGEDFPPHRLRAERATQIVLEYGELAETLTDWMAWSSIDQAMDYASLAPRTSERMMSKAKEKFG